MERETAEIIAKKSRALKHCEKILKEVDKKGLKWVKFNNTGVEIKVTKGDAIYLRIQSTMYQLLDEIHSIEVANKAISTTPTAVPTARRIAPAPVGAAPITEEELADIKRAKKSEYNRRYYEKQKAKKGQAPQ